MKRDMYLVTTRRDNYEDTGKITNDHNINRNYPVEMHRYPLETLPRTHSPLDYSLTALVMV